MCSCANLCRCIFALPSTPKHHACIKEKIFCEPGEAWQSILPCMNTSHSCAIVQSCAVAPSPHHPNIPEKSDSVVLQTCNYFTEKIDTCFICIHWFASHEFSTLNLGVIFRCNARVSSSATYNHKSILSMSRARGRNNQTLRACKNF